MSLAPLCSAPLRIKVCGFTRAVDVRAAVDLGVDFFGFNLARGPRRISVERAADLSRQLGLAAQAVALFVDASPEQVLSDCAASGCTIAQLHGTESPEQVAWLARRLPVIKALRVSRAEDLASAQAFAQAGVSALLLDSAAPGLAGGSGLAWDYALASAWQSPAPLLLAGGLNPQRVGPALAPPWPRLLGLDVASGVEEAPGRKCARAMAQFVAAVRAARPQGAVP
ncbi:MAG: phosphoribosylanthranilate isomerase [Planctomycetota bacterium]|nr:MAG: phosphoribosylanthranilate isomerase [Planctomycetota bacterium]